MVPNSETTVIVSKKAGIALDTLQPADQKRVLKTIDLLQGSIGELLKQGRVQKLLAPSKLFVIKATHKIRIIFSVTSEQVEVLDIVLADRLRRTFSSTEQQSSK